MTIITYQARIQDFLQGGGQGRPCTAGVQTAVYSPRRRGV